MKILLILFFLLNCGIHAQLRPALFQFKTDTVLQWHYHFGDEFSGQKVDESKWYPRYPWGGLLLDQSQWAVPEMLTQKNGMLHLGAKEFGQKTAVPNWMINENTRATEANLALVGKRRANGGAECVFEIAVGKNDIGVLAAEFKR